MYPGTHAQVTPDKAAVIMAGSGRTVSYRELDETSARLAKALHDLGLRHGDVVAMLTDNTAECFEIYWAALRSGLYLTAVNRHLSPDEAAYIVNDSDARVLIASAALGDLAEKVRAASPLLEGAYVFGGELAGFASYGELVASAGPERLTEQPRGGDMLYSSGTTGRPKGIKPPLLEISVEQPGDPLTGLVGAAFGVNDSDVYLSPAPIYHAAPLRWCGAVHAFGGTVVMMEKFDATAALEAIEKHQVTIAQMVPTMFVRMLQLGDAKDKYDVSSLRLLIHAAAPCPPEAKKAMIDWVGPTLVEYYGSTEGNGLAMITSQDWLTHPGSVGRSMLGPVHICDDEGVELGTGEIGSVYFERETLPFEYHKDPEKTRQAQHPAHPGWTSVGDVGYVDSDGFLYLTDRKSFMIISGGVNIYPQEVEDLLTLHPRVLDVAVIGIPDPEMGQQVKAVVQLKPEEVGTPEVADELIAYARERVAHYKVPRSVDFVDELPRTPTGKLVKRKLVDSYTKTGAVS